MTTKSLLLTIGLTGTAFIGSTAVLSILPCLAQTAIYSNVQSPTIVLPITNQSSIDLNSPATSQSNNLCFQVDENSKIYVRKKSGGNRYYQGNSSSDRNEMMKYPRCD
jgi:hypothetical protein